jgi:hypothetical protein
MIGVGVSVSDGDAEGANVLVANGVRVSELRGVTVSVIADAGGAEVLTTGEGVSFISHIFISSGELNTATIIVAIAVIIAANTGAQIVPPSAPRFLSPLVLLFLVFRPIAAS